MDFFLDTLQRNQLKKIALYVKDMDNMALGIDIHGICFFPLKYRKVRYCYFRSLKVVLKNVMTMAYLLSSSFV